MIDKFEGEYAFLSNFYEAPVTYQGITYRTSEAAFQAQKTLDHQERVKFSDPSLTPGQAKRLGRKITLRKDWEAVKIKTMYLIVLAKFEQHPNLSARLLATGDEELIEGNTWGDTTWGVCNGTGANNLGKILMQVRQVLTQETQRR